MNPFQSIYELIGEDQIRLLTRYFYQEVAQNQALRKLYPEEDLAPAERRLFLFLLQVFGGPQTYSEERGHPRLRQRHFDWQIGPTCETIGSMLCSLPSTNSTLIKPPRN